MIAKELLSSASEEGRGQSRGLMDVIKTLEGSLEIAIMPMLISFAMVVAMKVF